MCVLTISFILDVVCMCNSQWVWSDVLTRAMPLCWVYMPTKGPNEIITSNSASIEMYD